MTPSFVQIGSPGGVFAAYISVPCCSNDSGNDDLGLGMDISEDYYQDKCILIADIGGIYVQAFYAYPQGRSLPEKLRIASTEPHTVVEVPDGIYLVRMAVDDFESLLTDALSFEYEPAE